jgi:hypothetical protein
VRRWLARIPHPLDAFLVSRALVIAACAFTRGLFPHPLSVGAMPLRPGTAMPWIAMPAIPALDGWARWDSAWYWAIARDGYGVMLGDQSAAAFFPLFPLLAAVVSQPLRLLLPPDQAFYLGGFVVSNAAFGLAVLLFDRLARALLKPQVARRAVWLFCLYPFGLFFSAVYTESVFVACALAALWYARGGRFWLAAAAAGLAGLTRNVGLLVGVAVALEFVRQRQWAWRALFTRAALPLLLAPLGVVGYAVYLWIALGDPLRFLRAQEAWGHELALVPVGRLVHDALSVGVYWRDRLDAWACLGVLAVFPVLVIVAWRRYGVALGVFAAGALAAPLTAGMTAGLGRYSAVLFPAFLVLAETVRKPWKFRALCLVWAVLAVLFVSGFSHWEPPF